MGTLPFCFDELRNRSNEKIPYNLGIQENPDYFIPHRHNFIEYTYVLKGSGTETINSRKHILKPGTFSLLLPYQVHTLYSDPADPLTFYIGAISLDVFFAPNSMWEGLNDLLFKAGDSAPSFVHFEGIEHQRVLNIFKTMHEAYQEKNTWSELMFKAKLVEALVIFDQTRLRIEQKSCVQTEKEMKIEGTQGDQFWDIIYFLQTHYDEHITLKTLSQKFHLSVPYISASFKKYIGENYLDFLNEVRIQNACALLVSTDMSIIDIAFEVGYESYATFSRIFHKLRGVSAKQYRQSSP